VTQRHSQFVLITGISGFLGTALLKACQRAGYDVGGIDMSPCRERDELVAFHQARLEDCDLREATAGRQPDIIFHLAGGASVPASVSDPLNDFTALLPGTARLCREMRAYCPNARLVLFSSAAAYGNPGRLPVREDAPLLPISPYGAHKHLAETLVGHYSRLWCFPLTILRIFSAYGAGLRKQVFWDVGWRALEAVRDGHCSLTLYGTGTETRDFIHAEDVASAAVHLASLTDSSDPHVVNLASGAETKIADAVSMLVNAMGLPLELRFEGQLRHGDPQNWCADVSRLKGAGFIPAISLSQGLEAYASWIGAVLEDPRKIRA
jgi:UDP-glucose 4-epimerase